MALTTSCKRGDNDVKKEEVVKLLNKVDAFYPGKIKDVQKKSMFESWSELLEDFPFDAAMVNLKNHAMTSPFLPAIADVTKGQGVKGYQRGHKEFVLDLSAGEQ